MVKNDQMCKAIENKNKKKTRVFYRQRGRRLTDGGGKRGGRGGGKNGEDMR